MISGNLHRNQANHNNSLSMIFALIIKGPYNVETDDLDGLEKVLPDFYSYLKATLSPVVFREQKELPKNVLMEKIVQKISAFADDVKDRKFMLIETAAYLCQLGHGKAQTDGEKCRAKHEQSREWVKYKYNKKLELKYTRKLIYDTIVDFYDAQVAENVAEAMWISTMPKLPRMLLRQLWMWLEKLARQ
jgi:hypothetical protein